MRDRDRLDGFTNTVTWISPAALFVTDPPRGAHAASHFSLMLAASKDKVLAELKQQSLCLRQLELEYYIKRYTNIATQCVIIAGFAYDSLVEITISARMQERWGLGLGFGLGVAARLGFEAR